MSIGIDLSFLKNVFDKYVLFGIVGAWANFFIENYKLKGGLTIRIYLENWFKLLQLCFVGGLVGLLYSHLGDEVKAFLAGFGAMAVLEQLYHGKQLSDMIKKRLDSVEEDTIKKSEETLRKSLPEI